MAAETWSCAGCGGTVTLRASGFSETVACEHCGSVLDARDPKHRKLSQYHAAFAVKPLVPLGRRGTLRGEELEVIGFMRRKVRYYGVDYAWCEYLLYNPFKGYRWLLESKGHWCLLKPLPSGPDKKR